MKFSILCEVESRIKISKEIMIRHKNKEYIFSPNKDFLLAYIKIITFVSDPEKFYSVVRSTPNELINHNITINRDNNLYNHLISEFQELESILAFNGNLTKIKWSEPKEEIICETEEEKQKVNISGLQWKKEYDNPIILINESDLKGIIESKEEFKSLTIVEAFWREAMNDFRSFRYINAFFNFYFILEGLYGNGKTKNWAIEEEMLSSKDFLENLRLIIEKIKQNKRHFEIIERRLNLINKKLDYEGITHLLVSIRGDLHHFINNTNKTQGTPFNQEDFETIAWVSLGLATHAILIKIVEINQANLK